MKLDDMRALDTLRREVAKAQRLFEKRIIALHAFANTVLTNVVEALEEHAGLKPEARELLSSLPIGVIRLMSAFMDERLPDGRMAWYLGCNTIVDPESSRAPRKDVDQELVAWLRSELREITEKSDAVAEVRDQ